MPRQKGRGSRDRAAYEESSRSGWKHVVSQVLGEQAVRYLVSNPKVLLFAVPVLLMLWPFIVGIYALTKVPWGRAVDTAAEGAKRYPRAAFGSVAVLGVTLALPDPVRSGALSVLVLVAGAGMTFVIGVAGLNALGVSIGYGEALRRILAPARVALETTGVAQALSSGGLAPSVFVGGDDSSGSTTRSRARSRTGQSSSGSSSTTSSASQSDDRTSTGTTKVDLDVPISEVYHAEKDDFSEGGMFSTGPETVSLQSNYSTLVLGEPGAGKTTTMNLLIRQMDMSPEDPVVVFDFKGEFTGSGLFNDREIVTLSVDGGTVTWNVFREARDEHDYGEIAAKLVEDDEGDDEFFARAAQEVLEAGLVYLDRDRPHPTNRDLVEFFDRPSDAIHDDLSGHEDLRSAADYLDRPNDDVLVTVRQFVNQVFTGDFGSVGGFSVRNYVDDPDGQVLVIQTVISKFERTKPAMRFLIDWAIKYGLDDASRNTFYILDEFQRVPNLENIEMLTGVGRAQNAQAILGLQGISQLDASYDEDLADAIKAGSNQEILMRPGDPESVEYIQNVLGTAIVEHERDAPGFSQVNVEQEERQYISDRELRRFDTGEAIITAPDGFVHGQVKRWADLSRSERDKLQTN